MTPQRFDSDVFAFQLDSSEAIILYEVYSAKGRPNTIEPIGTWNASYGLHIPVSNKWERRNDLNGLAIINGILEWPLMTELVPGGEDKGFFQEVLGYLRLALNFTVVHKEPADGKFGGPAPDGGWNGIIGMLVRGEADVSASALTITQERSEGVDFLLAVWTDTLSFWSQEQVSQTYDLLAFLNILRTRSWIALVASLLMAVAFIFTLNTQDDSTAGAADNLWDSFFLVFTALLQLDHVTKMECLSKRIIVWTVRLSLFFIFTLYCALLTSTMTFNPPGKIRSVQDAMSQVRLAQLSK